VNVIERVKEQQGLVADINRILGKHGISHRVRLASTSAPVLHSTLSGPAAEVHPLRNRQVVIGLDLDELQLKSDVVHRA